MDKILIVDDEPDILRLVEVVLTATQEWAVLCASSGDQALEMAVREGPRAILIDGRMPGGGGAETLERLRREPATRAVPVILMTALAPERSSNVPPGFAGVIAKPFDPLTLPDQIRAILKS